MRRRNERVKRSPGRSRVLAAILWTASGAACMVGPDFQPPAEDVPAGFSQDGTGPGAGQPLSPAHLARWWTVFGDPVLSCLEERAAASNLDLKLAEARIRQARAVRRIAVSGLGPSVDATGAYRYSQSPGFTATGGGGAGEVINEPGYSQQFLAGFDAVWEADVFGRVRRGVEAADADLRSAVESRRDVLVSVTAEVARAYVDLRAAQERIAIARQNLAAQEHSASITRQRFQGGFASGLDVANAQALVATTASQVPLLEASAQQAIHGLSVLLGLEPAALNQELSPPSPIPPAPPEVPVGVPSGLLRRRPDIRAAEAGIQAATARIGVATADLFPRFTINGSAGFQAGDFGSWFDWASRFFSLGPSVDWRVFETGRIRAGIRQQEALQEQAFIAYRQTVLAALQEVEDALVASKREEMHRSALTAAVAANRKAVELATVLYTEGQTDFLNVLEPQKSLYVTQDALARSTQAVSTNLVALYKALGGGWEEPPPAAEKEHAAAD